MKKLIFIISLLFIVNPVGATGIEKPARITDLNENAIVIINNNLENIWNWINAFGGGTTEVSDTAYGVSWDTVTTIAPSKNAVYDKIETLSSGASYKIGSFTRDLTAATGNVAYTGIGFQPEVVFFIASDLVKAASVGFAKGTTYYDLVSYGAFVSDQWTTEGQAISLYTGVSPDRQQGSIVSFDSDGFTIYWLKSNVPTGTGYIYFLAIG